MQAGTGVLPPQVFIADLKRGLNGLGMVHSPDWKHLGRTSSGHSAPHWMDLMHMNFDCFGPDGIHRSHTKCCNMWGMRGGQQGLYACRMDRPDNTPGLTIQPGEKDMQYNPAGQGDQQRPRGIRREKLSRAHTTTSYYRRSRRLNRTSDCAVRISSHLVRIRIT